DQSFHLFHDPSQGRSTRNSDRRLARFRRAQRPALTGHGRADESSHPTAKAEHPAIGVVCNNCRPSFAQDPAGGKTPSSMSDCRNNTRSEKLISRTATVTLPMAVLPTRQGPFQRK